MPEIMWKSSIFNRLQGLIGMPVMTSLMDNAIHHPLWRKYKKGRGYEERVKKVRKTEILMRREKRVNRMRPSGNMPGLCTTASEPMSL